MQGIIQGSAIRAQYASYKSLLSIPTTLQLPGPFWTSCNDSRLVPGRQKLIIFHVVKPFKCSCSQLQVTFQSWHWDWREWLRIRQQNYQSWVRILVGINFFHRHLYCKYSANNTLHLKVYNICHRIRLDEEVAQQENVSVSKMKF